MKLELSDGWGDAPIPAHRVWVDHFWIPIKALEASSCTSSTKYTASLIIITVAIKYSIYLFKSNTSSQSTD